MATNCGAISQLGFAAMKVKVSSPIRTAAFSLRIGDIEIELPDVRRIFVHGEIGELNSSRPKRWDKLRDEWIRPPFYPRICKGLAVFEKRFGYVEPGAGFVHSPILAQWRVVCDEAPWQGFRCACGMVRSGRRWPLRRG